MIGMDLVNIDTAEESTLIKDYVETLGLTKQNVWISANKIGRATYAWVNGASMIYEDWYAGEPSSFADQHCLILYLRGWFDDPCLNPHYFLCEQL
ncbi:hypothetical protein B566_EDAN006524 [Ephemera danica]|nr:hypothetical protein B566_EDAN006524 [Ephemera danica]